MHMCINQNTESDLDYTREKTEVIISLGRLRIGLSTDQSHDRRAFDGFRAFREDNRTSRRVVIEN